MAMASLPSFHPHPLLLLPSRTRTPTLIPSHRPFAFPPGGVGGGGGGGSGRRRTPPMVSPFIRRGSVAVRLGPGFSDFQTAEGWARELFERAEAFVYTVADAAVSASSSPEIAGPVVEEGKKQSSDWLSGITEYMESVLKILKDGLSTLHVPYAYGFAIILLTIIVKAATFPLSKKQVESAMAMRSLQPQVKAIQERYAGDQERIQLETARLYKLAGVNPLAGCLPTLATIPVWIGLYRALSNVANEGLLTEGFFWIPSLAGPTTIAARQSGSSISWLFPFVDGHPPLGWSDTFAYLVLPALLVVSQYISAQIMQPAQGNDPSQKNAQAITKFLPLMIGYFALSVPSGLSLYWFTNNVLSTAQQIWLQKLGGAKNPVKEYNDKLKENTAPDVDLNKKASSQEKSDSLMPQEKLGSIGTQEKLSSTGPHPGDRFKQIKEQEARRKQEREEEKRRVEEAAKRSNINNDEQHSEVEFTESTMQFESSSVSVIEESQSVAPIGDASKVSPSNINGNHSKQEKTEEKTNVPSPATSNGGFTGNIAAAEKDAQDSHEHAHEEEAAKTGISVRRQTNEHQQDRTEQKSARDEA